MKLANPLYYPVAVLAGAIALVVGVRVAKLPSVVMLPAAVAIATLGAAALKAREPEIGLDPALEPELIAVRQQAALVANKASDFMSEATRLLTRVNQLELLGNVQYACDRAKELPTKIDQLIKRIHGADSLLSVTDLQQQLNEVEAKLQKSSGAAQVQLTKLADTLRRNIQLARQGQDSRQAQVTSLSTLIQDAAGVLQELQNKLRTADLTNASEAMELRSLSEELKFAQENVDLLVLK
jgi:hypothetical protein